MPKGGLVGAVLLLLTATLGLPTTDRRGLEGVPHARRRGLQREGDEGGTNVLVVYAEDAAGSIKSLSAALADGAASVEGSNVRVLDDTLVNYKRDVAEWADVVLVGSGVYNGNAAPSLLSFLDSFDFEDDLSGLVGGAFATAGGAAAGLQPVLEQLNRALATFNVITVGGDGWQNTEGTGVVTDGTPTVTNGSAAYEMGFGQGARAAQIASTLRAGAAARTQTPSPSPAPTSAPSPPAWGELWSATVSANLTQVGYDAGLVIVNFTGMCTSDPSTQQMRTVYGDFYTVLTRCDLGHEYTIAPASRGGACTARLIGRDVDRRICAACGCPFCVRDTNGTFAAGDGLTKTVTLWQYPEDAVIDGEHVSVYRGRAQGGQQFDLETAIAYDATDRTTPKFVNISHPLWVSTAARIDHFSRSVSSSDFEVPSGCTPPP